MKKISKGLITLLLMLLPGAFKLFAQSQTVAYSVSSSDIFDGRIAEKIWLNAYAVPKVVISDISYKHGVSLPKDAAAGDPEQVGIFLGMEHNRPFAVVRIPAFKKGSATGGVDQVSSFTLTVDQQPTAAKQSARFLDTNQSVLATGTWYKVGVTGTGFYKIDATLISSLGVDPSTVNPGNVRVFGNGGNMLSEDNAVQRPADLLENAVWVNAGGDNTFRNSDFVAFYAVGPTAWIKDSLNQGFYHKNNLYSDTAYYFITFDKGASMQVAGQAAVTPNVTASAFDFYAVHDADLVSPITVGKTWYGEQFMADIGTNVQTFSFDMGSAVPSIRFKVAFASTSSDAGSSLVAALNGSTIGSATFLTSTNTSLLITHSNNTWTGNCNCQAANLTLTFNPASTNTIGYLDYIEVSARSPLTINGSQLAFRDWQTVGPGNKASFALQGANSFTQVWDVTNPHVPVVMPGSLSGTTYTFAGDAQSLHEYAALNSASIPVPKFVGKVLNQNLHGLPQTDLIVVTYPDFIEAANTVASYHASHDNLRTTVVTTSQIYNEFSSGGQDICGIRDFVRMFYKRGGTDTTQLPKYLLLYGGASYDYKNRLPNNSNFVPTYETLDDSEDITGYSSDDIYGFLDDNENIEVNTATSLNSLDIAIGRLPSRNVADAKSLASKMVTYHDPSTLGPWRIADMFVADNGDEAGGHQDDAETMAGAILQSGHNLYNENKVYLDNIPVISTPAGTRAPNANAAIDDQIYKGVFMVNYNGHGNTEVWATERILTQDDYNNWNNTHMLPFMVTATCDFGQFDHPQFVSAAEQLLNRDGGGVIAMLTTTKAVYASYNATINKDYLASQYTKNTNGLWNTFGTACRTGKNARYMYTSDLGEIANFRKFALLGDPALTPDFPQYNISIDSITDGSMQHVNTIKALGKYTVNGSVRGYDSSVLAGFNGTVYISFYDKPRNVTDQTYYGPRTFQVQDNLIYKGKGTVTNGVFNFTFITPKDINYNEGTAKISTYAENGVIDAAGADTSVAVGGFSDDPVTSTTPPLVKPYINDSFFINGGITGSNTSLFVSLFDQTGINVSGYTIGHDLSAVLDGNVELPYILNDYYETAPNSYQQGYVNFPLLGLADGKHTMTVKAWDVNNNEGEGSVDFVVIDGTIVDIQSLGNYPNPFSDVTHFVFEHNHPDEQLDVQINIYATDGKLARNITQSFTPSGSRSAEITWNGTDNGGNKLPSGVYVYQLMLTTEKGYRSSAYQKLVIVR